MATTFEPATAGSAATAAMLATATGASTTSGGGGGGEVCVKPGPTAAIKIGTVAVRVEDDSSIGRSYSKRATTVAGLGAARKKLTTRTWHEAYGGRAASATTESFTLGKIHLSKCSRDDVRDYFVNTWDLTTTLFCGLVTDAAFYAVPDKLRRPLHCRVAGSIAAGGVCGETTHRAQAPGWRRFNMGRTNGCSSSPSVLLPPL